MSTTFFASIDLMMNALHVFSTYSGLKANPQKSLCFLSNPPQGLYSHILANYGILLGSLPSKFLGIPLITKKLSFTDCQPLIARIKGRIESWTSFFLSFAGRVQLIKSVLSAIQAYWCSHFILPKRITNHLQRCFARFLWNGHKPGRIKAKVAWNTVILPKNEVLGIKGVGDWNKALILKQLINLVNPTSKSTWADWVRKTIIKNGSFWTIQEPSKCSWILKKVLGLRDIARNHITYKIGNGADLSLWFDPWYNNRPICSSGNDPIILHSGLPTSAKVSVIIGEQGWNLPQSNYHDMIVWRNSFDFSTGYDVQKKDSILWDDKACKKIRVTDLWQSVRIGGPQVSWSNCVWHKLMVPRFSTLHWLIMLKRVNTLSRLFRFGVVCSENCFFCISGAESIHHLFLECPFTQYLFKLVSQGSTIVMHQDWNAWENEMKSGRLLGIEETIKLLTFQIVCYNLWRERNGRFHNEGYSSPGQIAIQCINYIKCRVKSSNWAQKEIASKPSLSNWIMEE